jgi:hypothetical protein
MSEPTKHPDYKSVGAGAQHTKEHLLKPDFALIIKIDHEKLSWSFSRSSWAIVYAEHGV